MILSALLGPPRAYQRVTLGPPGDGTADWWGYGATPSGVHINADRARTISAVYRAVELLSNAVKSLPLQVFERIGPDEKRIASDNPINRLLHWRPNEWTSPARFKKCLAAWVLLNGKSYAEIERTRRGDVAALHLIHPSRVRLIRGSGGKAVAYEVFNDNGTYVTIDAEDMLTVIGHSDDGIDGISVVGMARASLGLTVSAEDYGARLFGNAARPSVVLEVTGNIKDGQKKQLSQSWEQAYSGENAHKVAVLPTGVTAKPLSMNNDDAQFLETRKFQVSEVARWFGVPPHMLADLERATFSNIEHQGIEFVRDSVMPWAIEIEQACTLKLLPTDGKLFCEFNVDGLLRGDSKSRNEAREIQRRNGVINANEWRLSENMPRLPDEQGDLYIVPVNMMPLDRMARGEPANNAAAPAGRPPKEPPRDEDEERDDEPDNAALRTRAAADAACVRVLTHALEPCIRKEKNARDRAAKKPAGYEAWAGEFYEEHERTVRAAVIPGIESYVDVIEAMRGDPVDRAAVGAATAEAVRSLIKSWRSVCIGDCGAAEVAESIQKCISSAIQESASCETL